MDVNAIRNLFPIYKNHPNLHYLDSAATALKPQRVLDKMNEYYSFYGVNIHRGVYSLSYQATDEVDKSRVKVANFINASPNEIIFTRNCTESLNLACMLYSKNITKDDEILTSELEHHSNLLPWQNISNKVGCKLKFINLTDEARITLENVKSSITAKTKVLAITCASNVMGYITDLKPIIKYCHERNIVVFCDAAQLVAHRKIDVKDLDCDFLAFSGHKMMGPTGIGVLYGKKSILNTLYPVLLGGDMNEEVYHHHVDIKPIPYRFEAGTPAISEIIGLGEAIDFINQIGFCAINAHEEELTKYAYSKLKEINGITIYNKNPELGVINFNINNVHPHDAATFFDEKEIALRAGHHCAQLVTKFLKVDGTLRASFYIYNNKEDVDCFIQTIKETVKFFKQFN